MKASTIVWIVIILVVIGGAFWYFANNPATTQQPPVTTDNGTATQTQTQTNTTTSTGTTTSGAPMQATITYTSNGFSPSTVTIAKGGTVTWVNQSGSTMYVASDPHPVHSGYDGTTRQQHCAPGYSPAPFDQCSSGDSFTFTFDKVGSWGYHNHASASDRGTVIVE